MTLHPTASAVLPAQEELGLPWALFLSLKTDCVSQNLVCGLSPHSWPAELPSFVFLFIGGDDFFFQIEDALSFFLFCVYKEEKKQR